MRVIGNVVASGGVSEHMGHRVTATWVAVAALVAACGTAPASSANRAPGTDATSTTVGRSALDAIDAQLITAAEDVCTLVAATDVGASFEESSPLTTQPMGEANGPACGYPHPRHGGYLLVIQYQLPSRWSEHERTGRRVVGLAVDARLESTSELFVRDQRRDAVIMLLAPDGDAEAALLRLASRIYGAPVGGVHVEAS